VIRLLSCVFGVEESSRDRARQFTGLGGRKNSCSPYRVRMTKMELSLPSECLKLGAVRSIIQDIEIWRANAAEADAAFGLVDEYFEAVGVVSREDRGRFVEEYFGEGRGLWLAGLHGELAGCIALRRLRPPDGFPEGLPCSEIKRMYVRDKFREQGIAQKLLTAAERFARETGYAWIYLDTTNEMVAAARLYERNGYEACARYNENPQATIFMRKELPGAT
jgi:GNAT superfamily N-acetyltransferase